MIDHERFERVWQVSGGGVLRYARFATGSAEAGEDVAAETFVRFLEKGAGVPDERVEAWLFTVARNLATSHRRRERRWGLFLLAPPIADRRELVAVEEQSEARAAAAMLQPLGPRDRLALFLRFVEDRSFADVAHILGVSEDAAKKRVRRALERLRRSTEIVEPITARECVGGMSDG